MQTSTESEHNDFVIIDEVTDYARTEIRKATEFLSTYMQGTGYNVEREKTYEIPTHNGIFRVASFDTRVYKDDSNCLLEVSNPLYEAKLYSKNQRFWTTFNTGKKITYWTNEERILRYSPNPIWLFNIFAKKYYNVWEKYEDVRQKKQRNETLSAEDMIFSDKWYDDITADRWSADEIDVSPVEGIFQKLSTEEKEEMLLRAFEKMLVKE